MTPEEADQLQRKYAAKRKRWARSVGLPYAHDLETPEPAVLDGADDEEG